MTTRTDEIRTCLDLLNGTIGAEERRLERVEPTAFDVAHIAQLRERRTRLEAQLEREEAQLRKPTGPCVTLKAHDGVLWKV